MKIDFLGKSTESYINNVIESWKLSRPLEDNPDQNMVKSLDLPVNEFFVLNLSIECSIIEREIFTSCNNHVIWAQTSRVQNILEFEVHDHFKSNNDDNIVFEKIRQDMIFLSKEERQDDYRLKLPVFSMTKFSTSISIRDLIKIGKYFNHLYEKTDQDIFLFSSVRIFDFAYQLGYREDHFQKWKAPKILCEDFIKSETSNVNGNFLTVNTTLPLSLRAQLVRHRGLHIVDNLFEKIKSPNFKFENLELMIDCQVSGPISVFQEVTSKRACWIAQYNLWSDFLNKVTRIIPEMKLPCDFGGCPYDKDVILRYEGKDPNPPCPIHCRKNDLKITNDQRNKMLEMVVDDKRDPEFWDGKIFDVICEDDLK